MGGSKFVDYQDPVDHQIDGKDRQESDAQAAIEAVNDGNAEVPLAASDNEPAQPNSQGGLLGEVPVNTTSR
jgi:hypothetical protein